MTSIRCGKCKETHQSVHAVQSCYQGSTVAACSWLVERCSAYQDPETGEWLGGEDGPSIVECGAEAIFTDWGFECAAGHSHVRAEVRHAEGWDYAEDHGEAELLSRWGTEPRDLVTGGAFRY